MPPAATIVFTGDVTGVIRSQKGSSCSHLFSLRKPYNTPHASRVDYILLSEKTEERWLQVLLVWENQQVWEVVNHIILRATVWGLTGTRSSATCVVLFCFFIFSEATKLAMFSVIFELHRVQWIYLCLFVIFHAAKLSPRQYSLCGLLDPIILHIVMVVYLHTGLP